MPDLLTHVLVVYAAGTALAWTSERVDAPLVAAAMIGGVLPDLAKGWLVLSAGTVTGRFGLPGSWLALHRLGGVVLLAGIAALAIDRSARRSAFGALLAGGFTHLFLDALIRRASGLSPPYLYPLTWWHPPAGMLYLSADVWPALVSGVLAAGVWWYDRTRSPTAP